MKAKEQNKKEDKLNKILIPIGIGIIVIILTIIIIVSINLFKNNIIIIDNNDPTVYNDSPGDDIPTEKEDITYNLELLGDATMTIYQGETYIEPGYKATDSKGNTVTEGIYIDNNVDIDNLGEYNINYILNDITVTRTVKVIEKVIGVTKISLKGETTIYLNIGDTYKEPGYEVSDTVDGDKLKESVVTANNINTKKAGSYQVTYTVTNSSGITTSAIRKVIVMDSKISLTLNNNAWTNQDVTINIHIEDSNFDYMLLPNNEKITSKDYRYKVSSNGEYKIKAYSKNGTSKEASIKVSNIDKTIPTGSCSGTSSTSESIINVTANDESGIAKYIVNDKTYTTKTIKISSEIKNAVVKIYDNAGNMKEISCALVSSSTTNNNAELTTGNMKNISDRKPIWKNTAPNNGSIYVNHYTASNGQSFSFWSYVPTNATKNLPLVIYIPPASGDDYEMGTLDAFEDGPILHLGYHYCNYNAIVIHLQFPKGTKSQDYASSYMELIRKIVKEFDIDKNNISIMGFSNGCYGANNIINQNPNYFAAAVMIGCTLANPGQYVNTPLWCFSGSGDGLSSYYGTPMPNFVDQVKNLGGHAWFTATGTGHNVFENGAKNSAIYTKNAVDWMISPNKLNNSYKEIKSCK